MNLELRRQVTDWLARWSFPILVGCAAAAASVIAWSADLPARIPSYALQAAAVYRFELGAAVFLIVYFGALMLTLAFRNRAFTEIGRGSLKAESISSAEQEQTIRDQGGTLKALTAMVEELHEDIQRGGDRDG